MTIQSNRAVDAPQPPATRRVLTADRLFTGASTSHVPQGAVVLNGETIAWAGPQSELPGEYAALPRADFGDATILPGLVEVHAHLGSYSRTARPDVPDPARHAASWETLSAVKIARQLASVGVTTVQSLGSHHYEDVALREAIRQGIVEGPRIVAAGPPITPSAGHGWESGGEIDSIPDILHQVRDRHKAGSDVIKITATGGFMSHSTQPWNPQFTTEELKALIEDAHRLGKHVAAHAHGTEGIRRATAAGIDLIAHGSFVGADGRTDFDPRLADEIARKGIFVDHSAVPTYPPVDGEGFAARAFDLYEHGVKIVVGHDIGAVLPASAYTFGLRQLEAAGLPRAEVLIAATSRGAAAVGQAGVTGVLGPGYAADLIVVVGDPLADLGALDHLRIVIIGGRDFHRDWLAPFDPARRLAGDAAAPGSPLDKRAEYFIRHERAAAHPLIQA
jgi:imidazolonepropionase-like amidohydrolase